ncbi:hypothetical protein G6F31_016027 [Rhizopus arrhizus]|nr:hypothetical protein G6F31_016027 [Rhizopus arrhizus]
MLVAEHLQIGVVGPDVHAFLHIGDGVARGGDQRVAAALGFAHLCLDAAQATAGLQVHPLVADHGQQMLGALAQGEGADAMAAGLHQLVLIDALGQQHQRNILAAGGDVLGHQRQWNARRRRGQHQVDGLAVQHLGQLGRILRAPRAHRDATVAQGADDGFGILAAVIDDQQADDTRCAPNRPCAPPLRASNGDVVHTTPPAAWPLAQAHWKLYPPSQPVTSSTSPTKCRPGTRLDSIVEDETSAVSTPPRVTSAVR